jgi:membrane-associated phospholipid phosphatase
MAAIGWIVFLIYPTACARPSPDGQPAYYAALLVLDRPNNCLPCLHSAFSVLAVWALMYRAGHDRRLAKGTLLVVWLALICVSIVALRQHTDIDMVVGVALGCVGAWIWTPTIKSPA